MTITSTETFDIRRRLRPSGALILHLCEWDVFVQEGHVRRLTEDEQRLWPDAYGYCRIADALVYLSTPVAALEVGP